MFSSPCPRDCEKLSPYLPLPSQSPTVKKDWAQASAPLQDQSLPQPNLCQGHRVVLEDREAPDIGDEEKFSTWTLKNDQILQSHPKRKKNHKILQIPHVACPVLPGGP